MNPSLSVDQYTKLMELLYKHQLQDDSADSSPHALLAGNFCFMTSSHTSWILDSGSTDHMCANLDMFDTYMKFEGSNNSVTVPNGRKIQIVYVGTVSLNDTIVLHYVFHVPDFHFNLVSVKKLCQDLQCHLVFTNDTCFVQDPLQKKHPLPLGNKKIGLYTVKTAKVHDKVKKNSSSPIICCTSIEETKMWHLRLDHIPFPQLKIA